VLCRAADAHESRGREAEARELGEDLLQDDDDRGGRRQVGGEAVLRAVDEVVGRF